MIKNIEYRCDYYNNRLFDLVNDLQEIEIRCPRCKFVLIEVYKFFDEVKANGRIKENNNKVYGLYHEISQTEDIKNEKSLRVKPNKHTLL